MRYATAAILAAGIAACSPQTDAPAEETSESVDATETVAAAEFPTAEAIESWLKTNYSEALEGGGALMYRSANVDLDGDGSSESLVYVAGPYFCGTGGCPLVVLTMGENDFRVVTQTSITQLPVGVLESSNNGWRDIWVTTSGGGAPNEVKKLSFDGTSYPENPTVAPAETISAPGQVLIEEGELKRIN